MWASSSTKSKLRSARDQSVEIHFLELMAFVLEALARNDLEAVNKRLGLFAAMGLNHADDDIVAVLQSGPCLLQHLIGLADAGRGTEKIFSSRGASLLFAPPWQAGRPAKGAGQGCAADLPWGIDPCAGLSPTRALLRAGAIQSKVQRKHINARLAEDTESTALDMLGDELAKRILRHVARLRNARDLEIGGFRRDVRVEPAARRGYQVDRNLGGRVLLLQLLRRRP